MNTFIESRSGEFEKTLDHLNDEFKNLRTGRANPALVEGILVEAYGAQIPIKQVATITTPDSKTLLIAPWDKSLIKEIEKAITYANIGLTSSSTGEGVIINIPMLTEENRRELVKIMNQKAEEARITGRGIRDRVKESILEAEKNKEITEDDRYKFIKELDEYIQNFNLKVKNLAKQKEEEIMTI